jgi:sugar/nucleoside kinase (ribokinase family)
MLDVIVVGDIDTDTFYIVPHIPQWDEGVLVHDVYEFPGGKGANTASALSKLGIQTGILSAVGDDRYGAIGLEGLKRNKVDTSGVIVVSGAKTYYCIMMLDATGEKAILVVDTDLIYPTPDILKEKTGYLKTGRHAHFIGIEPLRMANTMRIARESGMSVSVDLDAAYSGYEACLQAIQWADVVFVNRQGATNFFPDLELEEILFKIREAGPSIVVVTSGKDGAIGYDGKEYCHVPSYNVPVVDTTGAGDVFSAGFIYGYLQNWNLERSIQFGSASAALSIAKMGGQSALPTSQAVDDFIQQHTERK